MNYEEIYNKAYNNTLEKIAEKDGIRGGWFKPDISALEDTLPEYVYLSDEDEEVIRPHLKEESEKRFALRHPLLTGLPTLGLWPAIAASQTLEKGKRKLAKINPEFMDNTRKAYIDETNAMANYESNNAAIRAAKINAAGRVQAARQ